MDKSVYMDHFLLQLSSKQTPRKKRTSEEKMGIIKLHPICVYCGCRENLVLDHIYPISLGGKDDLQNLTIACSSCNSRKHNYPVDMFLGVTQDKREYTYNKILTYVYNLRQLRKGKPCHFMHNEQILIGKILQLRADHNYFTRIIASILKSKYKILS